MTKLFVTPRRLLLVAACAVGIHSSLTAQDLTHYNKKEIRQLMQQAKTADDYRLLATYFVTKENAYRAKAQVAEQDYEAARRHVAIPKYPAPADTAKWFYQYDISQADQMAKSAALYEQKLKALNPAPKVTVSSGPTL